MYSLHLSLKEFEKYVNGSSSNSLKKCMTFYDDKEKILKRDFHQTNISANDEIIADINQLLKSLNIPASQWHKYDKNLSIYHFLLKLAQEGYSQIDYIIELIDKKTRLSKLDLFIGGTLSTFILACLVAQPAVYSIIEAVIQALLASTVGIPIIALFFTLGSTLFNAYQNHTNKKITFINRLRDNFFLFMESTIKTVGYGFLIAAGGTMIPVVACLFVLEALVSVVKEMYSLLQYYIQYKTSPPINESDNLNIHRAYARRVFGYEKHRNELLINITAALILVGIMAVACFVPGGLYITIASLAAIALVYVVKTAVSKINDIILRNRLQHQLEELEWVYSVSEHELNANTIEMTEFSEEQEHQEHTKENQQTEEYFPIWTKETTEPDAGSLPFFKLEVTTGIKITPEPEESNLGYF